MAVAASEPATTPVPVTGSSTVAPVSRTVSRSVASDGPSTRAVTSMASSPAAGRRRSSARWVAGRASSHTLCQIPDDGVKHTPSKSSRGMLRCLPCASSRLSSGAETRTSTS